MREYIHTVCKRSSKYYDRWVDSIISSFQKQGLGIGSLRHWAVDSVGVDAVKKIFCVNKVSYMDELFSTSLLECEVDEYYERYVRRLPIDKWDTIILKSFLGTGKTFRISELFRGDSYKRVLIVSARRTYSKSLHGELNANNFGFENYEYVTDYRELSNIPRLIIQVESLWKIGNEFHKYDLVILDEIESILYQLHSVQTNGVNLIANHEMMEKIVGTADKVIFADAFVTDRCLSFCKELRNIGRTIFINNTFQPYQRKAVFLLSTEKDKRIANLGGLYERITEALKKGLKIVIIWTSKKKGNEFIEKVLKPWGDNCPTWRFYSSDNSISNMTDLNDVGDSWKNVQCLMMTTSITIGINYDSKEFDSQFDEIFLYGTSASALPRDIAQALLRVRTLKNNKLTYVIDSRSPFKSDMMGKDAITHSLKDKVDDLISHHPLTRWASASLWVRLNHIYNENETNISRAEYQNVVEKYLLLSGYEIVREPHVSTDKIITLLSEDLGDKFANEWENIDEIDDYRARSINYSIRKGFASVEDKLMYRKWNFIQQFSELIDKRMLREWWDKFFLNGNDKQFWNIVREKRMTVDALVKKEADMRYAIMASGTIKAHGVLERFLKIVDMKCSQDEKVIDMDVLESLGAVLEPFEEELRDGLGLRKSQRKKKEWTVANTIEIIGTVLKNWGCCDVESVDSRKQINKKRERLYTLKINSNNKLWGNILDDHNVLYCDEIEDDECLIKL